MLFHLPLFRQELASWRFTTQMSFSSRVISRLNTINEQHPWSHNDAYTPWVLHQARCVRRAGGTRALDVGCGTGNLVAKLAGALDDVTGAEPDPAVGTIAEDRFRNHSKIRIEKVPFQRITGEYDLISMVAVLHHLPLSPTLQAVARMLRPGGRLVVVGIARDDRRGGALSTASMLLNPLVGLLRHPRHSFEMPLSMTAPTAAPTLTISEIRAAAPAILPGIAIHRGLFWRYLATWTAPW